MIYYDHHTTESRAQDSLITTTGSRIPQDPIVPSFGKFNAGWSIKYLEEFDSETGTMIVDHKYLSVYTTMPDLVRRDLSTAKLLAAGLLEEES